MDILRSLPIGLYLEQPITWLHRLDPRIKLFGLLTVLLSPIQANAFWRIAIAVLLIILTFASRIPMRIWKQQMGILLLLAFMTLAIAVYPLNILITCIVIFFRKLILTDYNIPNLTNQYDH